VSAATEAVRLLVVQSDPTDPPALLGDWWREVGVELVEIRADAGEPVPSELPADVDGLVVLGGAMAAWEDEVAPWLPDTRALLVDAVRSGRPVLGVCLGGQLMSLALGGAVERTPTPEVGVTELALLPAAANDRLFSVLPADPPVAQYHGDAITALPAGAVLLASTPDCVHQAYRLGDRAWAVQFHPEVDADIVESWTDDDPAPVQRCGLEPEAVVAGLRARGPEMATAWRPFAHAFADVVREHAAG
jgi:GMP synthase-like glutamine amidotransferase